MNRRLASSTRYTETWLATVAEVRKAQRRLSRSTSRRRNRPAASAHAGSVDRRTSRSIPVPAHRATRSSRRISRTSPAPAASTATPTIAPESRSPAGSPSMATRATATNGRASLTAKFAIPVDTVTSPTSLRLKPHEVYIA